MEDLDFWFLMTCGNQCPTVNNITHFMFSHQGSKTSAFVQALRTHFHHQNMEQVFVDKWLLVSFLGTILIVRLCKFLENKLTPLCLLSFLKLLHCYQNMMRPVIIFLLMLTRKLYHLCLSSEQIFFLIPPIWFCVITKFRIVH